MQIAADHVDVYLTWGEPPALVAEKIARMRKLAESAGRKMRFGIRLHVIVRETNEEAWQAANDLIRYIDRDVVERAQQGLSKFDSEGQKRMASLVHGNLANLEISPNLWAGIGLVRSGAGTALVGDPSTVAQRMLEYADLGIDTFILSGYPHLEEAYRVAELLFPLLPLSRRRPRMDAPLRQRISWAMNSAPSSKTPAGRIQASMAGALAAAPHHHHQLHRSPDGLGAGAGDSRFAASVQCAVWKNRRRLSVRHDDGRVPHGLAHGSMGRALWFAGRGSLVVRRNRHANIDQVRTAAWHNTLLDGHRGMR